MAWPCPRAADLLQWPVPQYGFTGGHPHHINAAPLFQAADFTKAAILLTGDTGKCDFRCHLDPWKAEGEDVGLPLSLQVPPASLLGSGLSLPATTT